MQHRLNPLAPAAAAAPGAGGAGLAPLAIGAGDVGHFESASRREWLVTNGLGGFACGTVSGAGTRRYHGWLMAALEPPVRRTLLVAGVDVRVLSRNAEFALGANEYADGTVDPAGFALLESFALDGTMPVWRYGCADALIEQRVFMVHGQNTTVATWRLLRGEAPLELRLAPLCTYRDYHAHGRGGWEPRVTQTTGGCRIDAFDGARPYHIVADAGRFVHDPAWHWNFLHRMERARGLDDIEDLFRPGCFTARLAPGETLTLTMSAEPQEGVGAAFSGPIAAAAASGSPGAGAGTDAGGGIAAGAEAAAKAAAAAPAPGGPAVGAAPMAGGAPAAELLAAQRAREAALLRSVADDAPAWIRRLVLAADQYVVRRQGPGGERGTTVIAGYPWFADWGRDTMIALPGLTVATGRYEEAASILRTFARHVSEGMLPNRFPDAGDQPEYNTADATLWYFVAVREYLRATGDETLAADLYPVLADIVGHHRAGTRYGIRVDEGDGLLFACEPGVQLTWMDAKVGDWVVTPRIGKPVEINALWHTALRVLGELAERLNDTAGAGGWIREAQRVAESFRRRFWFEAGGHLYDVIDGPEGDPGDDGRRRDARLRPNQIFAVSLPFPLLDGGQARSVVEVCGRELYTRVGLRSLARGEAGYTGRYGGAPLERDGAYHQGTVWSWLAGPYAEAHFRVHRDAPTALSLLAGMAHHLEEGCLGSVSEIFDGDPPHTPRGCFAQAWGVAETLRAWLAISAAGGRKLR